jgi:PAS domain S-box-containing protein
MTSLNNCKTKEVGFEEKIIQQTTDAVLTTDTFFRVVSWNNGAKDMYGYCPEEVIGERLGFIFRHQVSEEALEETRQHLKQYGFYKGEYSVLKRNGDALYVDANISELKDVDNVVIGYVAIHRDITARKKNEDQLKTFNILLEEEIRNKSVLLNNTFERSSLINQKLFLHLTNSPFGIIEWGIDRTITSWSPRAENIFEWTETEAVGKTIDDLNLVYKEDGPEVSETIRSLLIDGKNRLNSLNRNNTKSGKVIYCEWNNSILRDVNGRPTSCMSFVQDVSEQKKTELALIESENDLRNLSAHLQNIREEERANIAREIHDELGERLTGIRLDISWIEKKISPSNKSLLKKFPPLLNLVDNTIKTVRKISTELRPSILDDFGLVEALEWQVAEFEKRTGINCRFLSSISDNNYDKKISITLFRILQESLTNVLRHASAKNISVQLLKKDNILELSITDDGIGIDAKTVKGKQTLGLIGMKERVFMVRGKYSITSEKDKGTSILVSVPLNKKSN